MAKIKTFITKHRIFLLIINGLFFFIILTLTYINFYFRDKIYYQVKIAGVDLSRMTKNEAQTLLTREIKRPKLIVVNIKNETFNLDSTYIDYSYKINEAVNKAFFMYRSGNFIDNTIKIAKSLFTPVDLELDTVINRDKLLEFVDNKDKEVLTPPIYPQVTLNDDEITVQEGSAGEVVDLDKLNIEINNKLLINKQSQINVPIKTVNPQILADEAKGLKERAKMIIGKKIVFSSEYESLVLKDSDLIPLIAIHDSYNQSAIKALVEDKIAITFNRVPQNAVFKEEDGKVVEFLPAKDGIEINKEELINIINDALAKLETGEDKQKVLDVPVNRTVPTITTEEVNNLGIKNLIGRGTSKFAGSITSRIHNVSLAASKFNDVLIAPGETFSFNQTLGDVSIFTGFKQAYIIKDGKTILGDGGGVCQVSTTLFRALLNAGLPIIERHAHSYRVGYYEQDSPPGLDATVYSPSPDLKFKNDTPGYILIQTKTDTSIPSLIFELYGTSDGRVATISKPVISEVSAPPDDLYQDEPTLKVGVIKQIEHKAWGAKVAFKYDVVRDGAEIYQKTFISNYRPWQAVYLKGTANP